MRSSLFASLSCLLVTACAYDPPVNPDAPALFNVISGDVVFGGGEDVGPTYALLFAADNLPPPVGLGEPLTLSAVSPDAFTSGEASLRSAPYSITSIPDGDYAVAAITDMDGDFQPFATALAGATCGDWSGAHIASLTSTDFDALHVEGGQRVDDVTVLVGQPLDTERPAFRIDTTDPIPLPSLAAPVPPTIRISSVPVDTAFSDDLELHLGPACPSLTTPYCEFLPTCPCDPQPPPCSTAHWVWMKDEDGDGQVDPYPAEPQASSGVFDVWPRIYLESLGQFDTFVDDEGVEHPERWVTEAYPLLFELTAVLSVGGDPSVYGPVGVPFPVSQLSITLAPVFVHYHAGGEDGVDANGPFDYVDLREPGAADLVPDGAWSITEVAYTGQTWNVPNEIGTEGLPSLNPDFDPTTQAGVLTFTRDATPPTTP